MRARTGLWEPWVGNDPGPPGLDTLPDERTFDFQAGVRWLTFIIEDVPKTVVSLKAKGVEFMSDPVSAPDAKHVVCAKGPDGMLIEFVQLPD